MDLPKVVEVEPEREFSAVCRVGSRIVVAFLPLQAGCHGNRVNSEIDEPE